MVWYNVNEGYKYISENVTWIDSHFAYVLETFDTFEWTLLMIPCRYIWHFHSKLFDKFLLFCVTGPKKRGRNLTLIFQRKEFFKNFIFKNQLRTCSDCYVGDRAVRTFSMNIKKFMTFIRNSIWPMAIGSGSQNFKQCRKLLKYFWKHYTIPYHAEEPREQFSA